MDLRPPLATIAAKLATACESHGIDYALIGGLAAGAWGSPVATEDVDACVSLTSADGDRLRTLLESLESAGFRINVEALERRIARGHGILFLMIGLRRLDVMLLKAETLWEDVLRHRRRGKAMGHEFWLAAPEELIVTKLAAGRPKDLDAVRPIAAQHFRSLDLVRMRAGAQKLATRSPELPARLEALIAEARELDRLASEPPRED